MTKQNKWLPEDGNRVYKKNGTLYRDSNAGGPMMSRVAIDPRGYVALGLMNEETGDVLGLSMSAEAARDLAEGLWSFADHVDAEFGE